MLFHSNKGNVLSKYGISSVKKTEKDGTLTYYGKKKGLIPKYIELWFIMEQEAHRP